MDGSTALAVLGLEPGATKQQIKTTFRALVKGAHPDAFGGEVDTTDAFVTLRAAYDRALLDAPAAPSAPSAPTVPAADHPRAAGSWVTSTRPGTRIDITDVAVAANSSLRANMLRPTVSRTVRPTAHTADAAEQAFASLLADELAAA